MRDLLKFVPIMGLFIAGAVHAAPWSTIARNAESVVEIDSGSLGRKSQVVRAWSRQIYTEDQALPLGDPPFRAVRYLYSYECGRRTALLIRRTYVDEQGEAIKDQLLDGLEMAKDVIPGTLQERVYDFACKAAKEAAKEAEKGAKKLEPARLAKADAAGSAEDGEEDVADTAKDSESSPESGKEPTTKAAKADKPEKSEKARKPEKAEKVAKSDKPEKLEKADKPEKAEKGDPGVVAENKPGAKRGASSTSKVAAHKSAEDEDVAEHAKEPKSSKATKVAHGGKGKPAKADAPDDEEDAGRDASDEENAKPARKPQKVAMLDKKGKHDLDETCDNCEKNDEDEQSGEKAAKPPHQVHWEYEGKAGPQNWAKLSPEFAACGTGKFQSPIDIKEGIRLSLEPIKFDYKPSPLRIIDNGHTVQVNYGMGSSITVNGDKYNLVQFHFHKPSEERIDGKSFDMVVHLVHKNMMGSLAVVAVMLRNGAPNPLVQTLWTHLPLQSGKEAAPKDVKIDVSQFLPSDRAYYAFLGSLTTPPCTEGVLWLVMKNPMQVSRSQIGAFGRLYETNARPVQATNRRLIKESL